VVAVPSAYLAVQDHGQRLAHALDGFELQEEAENKELFWRWTAGLALDLVSYAPATPVALAADVINGYAPILLGMDGTWDQGVDRGLRFDAGDASGNALATLPPERAAQAHTIRVQAEAGYRRTAEALGLPEPPESPETDLLEPAIEIATGQLSDLVKTGHAPGGR
jgi:hypothetical protein